MPDGKDTLEGIERSVVMSSNLSKMSTNINYTNDVELAKGVEKELHEFIVATEEKIRMAQTAKNDYLVRVLEKLRKTMIEISMAFEEKRVEFCDAYEEITHLYVFSELYLSVETPEGPDIDFVSVSE